MPARELLSCLGLLWQLEERRGGLPPYKACYVQPQPILSHEASGQPITLKAANRPAPFILTNASGARDLEALGEDQINKHWLAMLNAGKTPRGLKRYETIPVPVRSPEFDDALRLPAPE